MSVEAVPARRAEKHPLLIVDDEPEVLESLRRMFRREYRVLAADRADAALEMLKNEDVHVVISDQRMPGMNGTEFLARVRRDHPHVIRLMMTGYTDIGSVVGAINEGHVFRYVNKPWDPGELASVIRQAADQWDTQELRRRLMAELEEANRLQKAFIAVANHELNTPLTIILGMTQMAQAKNADPAVKACLDKAQNAADRLRKRLEATFKLVEEGDFSHELTFTRIPVRDLLADIATELEPAFKLRRQSLEVDLEPSDLAMDGSRPHLRDVLENLIVNALKFSRDGQAIGIRGRGEDGWVTVEVIDRGVGIPPEDRPHILKPMFSTLDVMRHSTGDFGYCKRGMGLGLPVAKRFVELHGGRLTFVTEVGKGTTFRVDLPDPARQPVVPVNGAQPDA